MKILLIEDDIDYVETLRSRLRQHYVIDVAHDGESGFRRAKNHSYDVLVVDLVLPDMDGIALCQQLRAEGVATPILVLTAKDSLDQKVAALDAGADDYVVKVTTEYKELLARIRALQRRPVDTLISSPIKIADLTLDVTTRVVKRQNKLIELRRKEFNLLEYLMQHEGRVVTRNMILEHVWEADVDPLTNTIDVHINYLREKIDKPFGRRLIKTVPGVGYKLEP